MDSIHMFLIISYLVHDLYQLQDLQCMFLVPSEQIVRLLENTKTWFNVDKTEIVIIEI